MPSTDVTFMYNVHTEDKNKLTFQEALKLHIVDSSEAPVPLTIPEGQQPGAAAANENGKVNR